MLFSPTRDKIIAFSGLLQAGKLVTQIATEPRHDEQALRVCAHSLLTTESQNVEHIFNSPAQLRLGLTTMKTLLSGQNLQSIEARETIRYLMSMDQLATRLSHTQNTAKIIEQGLQELSVQFSNLSIDNEAQNDEFNYDDFYMRIGTLYEKSLSQLGPRIMVKGAPGHLKDAASVSRVRTALFAGVRAAYLWHQLGARRWHILFARRAYVKYAQQLMAV